MELAAPRHLFKAKDFLCLFISAQHEPLLEPGLCRHHPGATPLTLHCAQDWSGLQWAYPLFSSLNRNRKIDLCYSDKLLLSSRSLFLPGISIMGRGTKIFSRSRRTSLLMKHFPNSTGKGWIQLWQAGLSSLAAFVTLIIAFNIAYKNVWDLLNSFLNPAETPGLHHTWQTHIP